MIGKAAKYIGDRTSEARNLKADPSRMISQDFVNPPAKLTLGDDEIHIWFSVLDQKADVIYNFFQMLSPNERRRAGWFHCYEDKARFITRHGILRMILGHYLGVKPGEVQFYYGKNGKPAILETFGVGTIHFNLSHSNGAALFAFTRSHEIGVDIEYIHDVIEMEQIVNRFFSLNERDVFHSLPKSQKREAFFKGWTCKEAFVKALGDGLFKPLCKFDVSLVPGESSEVFRIEGNSREASRWSIQNLNPAPHYLGAFAVKSNLLQLKCWRWDSTELGKDLN